MRKNRVRMTALAAAGLAVLMLLLVARRSSSVGQGGSGAAVPRAAAAPALSEKTVAQVTNKAVVAQPRPALRGTYSRGEGSAVEIEVGHGLARLPVGQPPARIMRACEWGADARVALRVVDPDGRAVAGAHVSGCFYNNGREGRDAEGETDARGEFVLSGRCSGDLNFRVNKAGWYETALRYWCYKPGFDCVKDGRWQPWDPVLEITLKEQRKPIPMYAKRAHIKLPLKNKAYGFDYLVGDLVEPDGKGKTADILLKCWGDKGYPPSLSYSNELLIAACKTSEGFVCAKKDGWSQMPSSYEAPNNGYEAEIHLTIKRSASKVFENIDLNESEFVVFRTRTESSNGTLVKANYGKIYGPITYGIMTNDREGAGVTLTYYFNPTPNDRNLEFDGKTNLFRPKWSDTDWPHEP